VLTAVVTQTGSAITVQLVQTVPPNSSETETPTTEGEVTGAEPTGAESHGDNVTTDSDGKLVAKSGTAHVPIEEAAPGPNPIIPEVKELVWGAGAFIVFAVVMRYLAFPRLKKGMDARYRSIREDHESADRARSAAQLEVAEYQSQLAAVKAEAAAIIDEARQNLESTRTARLAAVNADIAQLRSVATAENEAARVAVQDQIEAAVADVAGEAIKRAVGKNPEPARVRHVVAELMNAGAPR